MSHAGTLPTQTLTPPIRVVLGPAPCSDCGKPVVWARSYQVYQHGFDAFPSWMEPDGEPHICAPEPWGRIVPSKTRHCSECRAWLPVSMFGRDRSARDGYNHRCKLCSRARDAARRGAA